MDYESNEFITLRFPRDNTVFQQFNNKTLEEQETIIRLGTVMHNTGKTRKTALNNAEWGEKLEESNNRISKISNDYDVKIKEYKAQIRKLKDEKKEELENGIKEAIELEKAKYSSALSSAEKKYQELSNELDTINNNEYLYDNINIFLVLLFIISITLLRYIKNIVYCSIITILPAIISIIIFLIIKNKEKYIFNLIILIIIIIINLVNLLFYNKLFN